MYLSVKSMENSYGLGKNLSVGTCSKQENKTLTKALEILYFKVPMLQFDINYLMVSNDLEANCQ